MRKCTLVFLIDPTRICLALKKRGFGEGKVNGYGGKVAADEAIVAAACRELKEESGVSASPDALDPVATLEFSFEGKPDWSQEVHAFLLRSWEGEPQETEEMQPLWTPLDAIPYDRMWIDDIHWLPRVLAGERLEGSFRFNTDGTEILKSELRAL